MRIAYKYQSEHDARGEKKTKNDEDVYCGKNERKNKKRTPFIMTLNL